MKRLPGELRYDFCARRIAEQQAVKEKLKGTLVWCSSAITPDGRKYKVQGTYRKPKKEEGK